MWLVLGIVPLGGGGFRPSGMINGIATRIGLGYTNIVDVEGGMVARKKEGYQLLQTSGHYRRSQV